LDTTQSSPHQDPEQSQRPIHYLPKPVSTALCNKQTFLTDFTSPMPENFTGPMPENFNL
jgi:hypothetical protein